MAERFPPSRLLPILTGASKSSSVSWPLSIPGSLATGVANPEGEVDAAGARRAVAGVLSSA